jgi:NAD+ diphosphatase
VTAAFTGARLDRAGDARRRDPDWVAAQRSHPAARAVMAGSRGVVMDGDRLAVVPLDGATTSPAARAASASPATGSMSSAARAAAASSVTGSSSPALVSEPGEPLLLGVDDAGPLFAIDIDAPAPGGEQPAPLIAPGGPRGSGAAPPEPADGPRAVGLREAVTVLPPGEGGLVAYLASLLNWHRRHAFCAACGAPTHVAEAGLTRACPRCGTHHHPRTDPVVIMLVEDGDRLLLGRSPAWPPRRYSALAGFVEPGESLEEAVVREVLEESGVRVGGPRYLASQPWPFPSSLMVGFIAPWESGEPAPGEEDIDDVRWFDREEVAAAAADDAGGWGGDSDAPLLLPPRLAIARRLIERWLAG